jgi:hypothetical protein
MQITLSLFLNQSTNRLIKQNFLYISYHVQIYESVQLLAKNQTARISFLEGTVWIFSSLSCPEWQYVELHLMDSGYSFFGVQGSHIMKLTANLHL